MNISEANMQQEQPTTSPTAVSRFEHQREALSELMSLAGECARENAKLRDERDAAGRNARAAFDRDAARLDEELAARTKSESDRVSAARQGSKAEHDAARGEADREAAAAGKTLADRRKRAGKHLQKKQTDESWLVDTMLESASARVHEATASTRKLSKEQAARFDELDADAAALVRRYGQSLPVAAADVEPLSPPAEEPATREALPAALESYTAAVEARLAALRSLVLPRLFVGVTPWAAGLLMVALAAGLGHAYTAGTLSNPRLLTATKLVPLHVGVAAGLGLVVALVAGLMLRNASRRRVREAADEFAGTFAAAQAAVARDVGRVTAALDEDLLAATAKHQEETGEIGGRHRTEADRVKKQVADAEAQVRDKIAKRREKLDTARAAATVEIDAAHAEQVARVHKWEADARSTLNRRREERLAAARAAYDAGRAALVERWETALRLTQELSDEGDRPEHAAVGDWRSWTPPQTFASTVRFGQLDVDVAAFAKVEQASSDDLNLPVPPPYEVPALLAFPDHANLLLKHEPAGREAAVASLRLTMLRLLTSLPPGRVRFTLFDPVGLGRSFAAFMHLADFDDELVGGRVWTESEAIEARLGDLTEHMETVIQKYLRNEYATIDDYNAQAGELAEPYHFLVIADLPQGFNDKALSRLASIAASGARCGVHILAALDTRQTARGAATALEDVESHSTTLVHDPESGRFRWELEPYARLPLTLDAPPEEAALTDVLRVVGRAAKEAKRVEVDFGAMTPGDGDLWSRDSARDLHVPVGRSGATRLHDFALGRGVAQHALVAGKTGSGKSTLLNGLITNLSLWYAPDQLELYLVDFKRGVEFRAYAAAKLPHARAVAIESDREFGLSVLQRLDEELGRRGDLFRANGVQDVAGFRRVRPDDAMPRVLLVVDEFQELFSEDDRLAQDAALLIDRLVRQGRAFGIHVILGSQTLGGAAGLPRSTLGQMAVRVALQCTEADSQLILGDNNGAARLLSRPGEAIYNDAGGAVEANSPFQVAWLSDEQREKLLRRVAEKADATDVERPPTVVFEGSVAATLGDNVELRQAVKTGQPARKGVAYLGEPVAIKPPTHAALRRQAGGNLLVVGQQEDNVVATLAAALVSLALTDTFRGEAGADLPARPAAFRVLDGTPADSPFAGKLREVAAALEIDAAFVDFRALPDVMSDLAGELRDRLDPATPVRPSVYVVVNGLQRFRALQRDSDSGFSTGGGSFADILGDGDTPKQAPAARPGEVLADLLRDGPSVGIHVLVSVDTLAQLERRLSRESVREFDAKVLFQMSANDSSVLIDSPAANRLGFYRGLLASEEQGTLEKFRPYGLPDAPFLDRLRGGAS